MSKDKKDKEMICGLTADERDLLQQELRALPEIMPPRDVWKRIREQGEAEGLIKQGAMRRPMTWNGGFGLAAVTTELELQPDAPLAPRSWQDAVRTHGPAWWFGTGGTRPGWAILDGRRRPPHLGRYPMEKLRRVDGPTTLVLDDEVPRVPKRAAFEAGRTGRSVAEDTAKPYSVFSTSSPRRFAAAITAWVLF